MPDRMSKRRTIGFISSWHVYDETAIEAFVHELLQGVRAAARDQDCNLLFACGVGPHVTTGSAAPAWPVPLPDTDFVPVSPWNVDGIIVAPHPLTPAQSSYVQKLLADGFPIIVVGPEELGPAVMVDAAGGFRQAFNHLFEHGHRQIAFIAGVTRRSIDTSQRLQAYLDAQRVAGIAHDSRLVAYGEASLPGGRQAMRQILAAGAPFTAVLANNDRSAFGAIEALREAGRRVPEDVAVIGFDDILEARACLPPLTTIRQPTFTLGYQAALRLLDRIAGRSDDPQITVLPTQLVIRASCGCRLDHEPPADHDAGLYDVSMRGAPANLAHSMAEAAMNLARTLKPAEVEADCHRLLRALIESADASSGRNDDSSFVETLRAILLPTSRIEDVDAWQAALSVLHHALPAFFDALHRHMPAALMRAELLLHQTRLVISERSRQLATRRLIQHMALTDQLGMLTAQLLSALDESQVGAILTKHLPQVHVRHMLAARFVPVTGDPVAQSTVLFCHGLPENRAGERFVTQQFPPPHFYPEDEPFQLALLPLIVQDQNTGFVAFDAGNLEPCAAIVRNLAAALRSSHLYRDAVQGQRIAEQASQLKSRFLSMVSHELRAPLNLIVGLSEVLVREQHQTSPEIADIAQDLDRIHTSAQHLGRLISDVLDLASSEAGQLRVLREPLDLCEVLAATVITGEQMAREKGLRWQVEMPHSAPWVLGDRTRLRQVVINLLSNAVKFTTNGTVALRVSADAGQATVAVSDTGVGVTVAEQASIFDEFQRSERAVARGYSGLGLGLAICKHLVELHGGTIGLRSSGVEGSGSTFFFTLPTIDVGALSAEPDGPLEPGNLDRLARILCHDELSNSGVTAIKTILIVDDDPGSLDLHARLVRQLQPASRVLQAHSGREALVTMRQMRPDLLVLDLVMPGMDGFGVLDVMRAERALRDVPVVVLTAQALANTDMERLNRGVVAVLNKGMFSAQEVMRHIKSALEQSRKMGNATLRLVHAAIAFIHAHYAEPLTRQHIAGHVGVAEGYLTTCFHHQVGIPPMTYLMRYRVRVARALLEAGEQSVTEVALAAGFSDSAHFSRVFLREVGVSPSAYRQGKRAEK